MQARKPHRDRWRARPVLAGVLRVFIFFVPIAVALAVSTLIRPHLPAGRTWAEQAWWWGLVLLVSVAVALIVERLGRRILPLVMLFKLSMLFPNQAPSRFAVARQAGSVRGLETRLAALEAGRGKGEETSSAATILALATALQSHDRQTRGHAERVRVFTDLVGEELKLAREDRYHLRWAALLHDIGKLRVAPRILNKPGKLDDGEWAIIRGHPLEGARIAAPLLDWLGPWAGAIAEHHERFDGGGYPGGLAGPDISLAGRIVAVADAYDTMTAVRSYKKPMAVREARQELVRCAGGQFDPMVVRAFLAISVPRLLWKTGPGSLLVQLPFLARLQEIGQHSIGAAVQGVTTATVVAGVAAATLASSPPPLPVAGRHMPSIDRPVAGLTPSPAPTGDGGSTKGPQGQEGGVSEPSPQPSPTPGGTPSPSPEPSPSPSKSPSPEPSPSPTDPLPLPPLPSVSPLPLPPLPPLPLPTPSGLPSLIGDEEGD
ncbi:MAG TPA: HD domain-containing phosphohydrolase [Actinomycetota bacterium]|nr:HD domain-containing phosphohydrolase [Actinomycetota bacterium]